MVIIVFLAVIVSGCADNMDFSESETIEKISEDLEQVDEDNNVSKEETFRMDVGNDCPENATIDVNDGDKILFHNDEDSTQTVTIEELEIYEEIGPGRRIVVGFDQNGEYKIDCSFHTGEETVALVG